MTSSSNTRTLQYKPWLMTTTLRNPERLIGFLQVLKTYDGMRLTNSMCVEIEGNLIKNGLYKPMKVSPTIKSKWALGEELTSTEVSEVLEANPQNHKEAGFDKGWPSRFDTHFKIAKLLGFVFYQVGEPVKFSDLGNMYVDETHPENEQLCFLNALVNYHRKNPYQRVLNRNRPLVLLLQVLQMLKEKDGEDSPGIARHELPLLLVWPDEKASALFDQIQKLRARRGFKVSDEEIFSICEELNGGWHNDIKMKTIVSEEPDEILRKFRLTGLFSLRGEGRFLSINKDSEKLVSIILAKHTQVFDFDSEREYFDFVSTLDKELLQSSNDSIPESKPADVHLLDQWIEHFGEDLIREEMKVLVSTRKASQDPILRLVQAPLRLEFLTSMLLRIIYEDSVVVPHYRRDDTGLPISHAPGNYPDIEIYHLQPLGKSLLELYEVTLINGTAQVTKEMVPITRHLEMKIAEGNTARVVFVAPTIHTDTSRYVDYLLHASKLEIVPKTVEQLSEMIA